MSEDTANNQERRDGHHTATPTLAQVLGEQEKSPKMEKVIEVVPGGGDGGKISPSIEEVKVSGDALLEALKRDNEKITKDLIDQDIFHDLIDPTATAKAILEEQR